MLRNLLPENLTFFSIKPFMFSGGFEELRQSEVCSQSQLRQVGMEADYRQEDSYAALETHQDRMGMTQR